MSSIVGATASGVGELLAAAAERPAGGDGLFFLPYLSGERAPHTNADARGAFVGVSAHHDRAAMTRAVIEGVALSRTPPRSAEVDALVDDLDGGLERSWSVTRTEV